METAIEDIFETVEQAKQGNVTAFARIVRRYQSLVSGVLFSATGDFHKSEDLAQETFLIAWNKISELREPEHLAAWLCTIARNLAHHSGRKPDLMPEEFVKEKASSEPGPEAELLRREQSELVWSAIGQMEQPYRESLVLYYRSGQSVQEIAAAMDSTEEAIRQRLVRARKSLKAKLEQVIGDVLNDTAPGDIFTYGVMAAIGTSVFAVSAETALAASAVATSSAQGTGTATIVGTGSATGKAAGLAPFWMILGPLAYFAWAFSLLFVNAWVTVRNAPTLRSRRFRVRSFIMYCQYFFLYIVALGTLVTVLAQLIPFHRLQIFGGNPGRIVSFFVPFGMAYLVSYLVARKNRNRFRLIIENELGLRNDDPHLWQCDTLQDLKRRLNYAVLINVLLLETVVGLLLILPITDGSSGLSMLLGAAGIGFGGGLVIYIFYRFGLFLLQFCQSESSLTEYPPLAEKSFEVALGLSLVNPMAVDQLASNHRNHWLVLWVYAGIILGMIWYFSLYDWSIHPITKGLCALSLVAIGLVYSVWIKKIKDKSKRNLHLCGGLFLFFSCVVVAILETMECGRFSLPLFFQKASMPGIENLVHVPNLCFMLMGTIGTIYSFVQWLRYSDENLNQRDNARMETVRQAVNRYQSKKHDTEVEGESKHFASGFWIRLCFGYAVVILLLFSIFSIFQDEIFGKSLRMKYAIRSGSYTVLIEMDPTNPIHYFHRGCSEGNPQKAVEDFDTALRLNPNYLEAYQKRAETYHQWAMDNMAHPVREIQEENKTRFLNAIADCDAAIQLDPKNDKSWRIRSRVHVSLGDYDTTIDDATQAITLKPVSTNVFERAVIYETMGDLQHALDDCTEAIRLQEKNNRIYGDGNPDLLRDLNEYIKPYYRFRARLYEKMGEHDKAQADLDMLKQL